MNDESRPTKAAFANLIPAKGSVVPSYTSLRARGRHA